MKCRLELAAEEALNERTADMAHEPQAVPMSYIDDSGIAAKKFDNWGA